MIHPYSLTFRMRRMLLEYLIQTSPSLSNRNSLVKRRYFQQGSFRTSKAPLSPFIILKRLISICRLLSLPLLRPNLFNLYLRLYHLGLNILTRQLIRSPALHPI